MEIRRLGEEYFGKIINANYSTFSGEEYIRDRIREACHAGAFRNGVLLGFAGMHPEGSVECWRCCLSTAARARLRH